MLRQGGYSIRTDLLARLWLFARGIQKGVGVRVDERSCVWSAENFDSFGMMDWEGASTSVV